MKLRVLCLVQTVLIAALFSIVCWQQQRIEFERALQIETYNLLMNEMARN